MPADQLGVLILGDLLGTNEWNEYNYLLNAQNSAIEERRAWRSRRRWHGFAQEHSSPGHRATHRTQ